METKAGKTISRYFLSLIPDLLIYFHCLCLVVCARSLYLKYILFLQLHDKITVNFGKIHGNKTQQDIILKKSHSPQSLDDKFLMHMYCIAKWLYNVHNEYEL